MTIILMHSSSCNLMASNGGFGWQLLTDTVFYPGAEADSWTQHRTASALHALNAKELTLVSFGSFYAQGSRVEPNYHVISWKQTPLPFTVQFHFNN